MKTNTRLIRKISRRDDIAARTSLPPIQQPHEHEPTIVRPHRAKPGVCMANVTEVNPAISERVAEAAKKNHLGESDDLIELPGSSVVLSGLRSARLYITICLATPGYGHVIDQYLAQTARKGMSLRQGRKPGRS